MPEPIRYFFMHRYRTFLIDFMADVCFKLLLTVLIPDHFIAVFNQQCINQ